MFDRTPTDGHPYPVRSRIPVHLLLYLSMAHMLTFRTIHSMLPKQRSTTLICCSRLGYNSQVKGEHTERNYHHIPEESGRLTHNPLLEPSCTYSMLSIVTNLFYNIPHFLLGCTANAKGTSQAPAFVLRSIKPRMFACPSKLPKKLLFALFSHNTTPSCFAYFSTNS